MYFNKPKSFMKILMIWNKPNLVLRCPYYGLSISSLNIDYDFDFRTICKGM